MINRDVAEEEEEAAEAGCAEATRNSSNKSAATAVAPQNATRPPRASERMLAEWRGKLARTKKENVRVRKLLAVGQQLSAAALKVYA